MDLAVVLQALKLGIPVHLVVDRHRHPVDVSAQRGEALAERLHEVHHAQGFDLDALGVDFSDGVDLKAISKRASQIAEKRVIDKVLQQTRWNRKEAALRLQISYKALLYKMKENGLSEGR